MTNIRGKSEAVTDFIFFDSKITAYGECSHGIKRRFLLGRKATTNLDSVLKSRDITWPLKVHIVKAMIFFNCHAGMWEFDHKKRLSAKELILSNCGAGKMLESPLDCKIKLVNLTGKSWIFRTECWSWSSNTLATWWEEPTYWKRPPCWKDWRRKEKRLPEDEMVR